VIDEVTLKDWHRAARTPAWLTVALALCVLAGTLRALILLMHDPLIALANSYDEVRYTACFNLYPDRPADIAPTDNSPQAPFAHYRFVQIDQPMCYWSSDLLLQGVAVAIYRVEEAIDGAKSHSVRWLGALKFVAMFGVWLAFTVVWLRRGEYWSALANGLLLPLLLTDPANAIYLNTFYAEWSALLATYTLCGVIVLELDRPPSTFRRILLAFAAFALATSKIQHLLLPMVCAFIVLGMSYWTSRRWSWQGKAILLGALAGLAVQVVQLQRDSDAIRAIDMFNRSDVTFTGLLPNARDPISASAELGLMPKCLDYVGTRAWEMSDYPGHVCPSLENVTRGRELIFLARHPDTALRLWWHGLLALNPWLAPGLGVVEGGDFQILPSGIYSLSETLAAIPTLRALVLSGPLLGLLVLLFSGRAHDRERFVIYTMLTLAVMISTLTITVLGDGLADTPKQGHLVVNAALAWWICVFVLGAGVAITRKR
jgi:hypothetical protein